MRLEIFIGGSFIALGVFLGSCGLKTKPRSQEVDFRPKIPYKNESTKEYEQESSRSAQKARP